MGNIPTRLPPHNLECEQALIGALMMNNRSYEKVAEFLRPEHFASAAHRRIFDICRRLIERGQQADPITVKNHLETDGSLVDVGGIGYLLELINPGAGIINVGSYGELIHDLALRRALIDIHQEGIAAAYGDDAYSTALSCADASASQLFQLQVSGGGTGADAKPIDYYSTEAMGILEDRFRAGGWITGVPSGITELDNLTGGFQPSSLVILGGRPSMGKTGLATTFALSAAMAGVPTLFFSLEMGGSQLAGRLLSAMTGIPVSSIVHGRDLVESDFLDLSAAKTRLDALPLMIDDTAGITAAGIASRARRWHRRRGIGLVAIDYLQLISADGRRKDGNATAEMGDISRALKVLAKDIAAPVLALSQLNRAVEARDDKRPTLADLRQSGSIEQDADIVMFVYRAEYYLGRSEPEPKPNERAETTLQRRREWEDQREAARGIAEIIVSKHRQGPVGTVRTAFDAPTTSFRDL